VTHIFGGVQRSADRTLNEKDISWLVFYRPIDGSERTKAEYRQDKPTLGVIAPDQHYIFFGLHKDDFESKGILSPVYVEYHSFSPSGEAISILNWIKDGDETIGLCDCFGREAFVELDIEKLEDSARRKKVTIAETIEAYLDRGCDVFRQHDLGQEVGITACKAEIYLHQQTELCGSVIDFSYVDPNTLLITKLSQLSFSHSRSPVPEDIRNADKGWCQPLSVEEALSNHQSGETNFALCLSKYGRRHILPTEVDRSYLCFSIGEVGAYLLHWFLLRIFACDDPSNRSFVEKFHRWRTAIDSRDRSDKLFEQLLESPVVLPPDNHILKEGASDLPQQERYLGIYQTHTPFISVLETIGLKIGAKNGIHSKVRDFLSWFVDTSISTDSSPDSSFNFAKLPMYRSLGWRQQILSRSSVREDDLAGKQKEQLETIMACLASASGLAASNDGIETARKELELHARKSVFPIAHILSHWPRDEEITHYYIFPLWGDMVREWDGPVIFAHVFTGCLGPEAEDAAVLGTALKFRDLLLPFGPAIAHSYYNNIRKSAKDYETRMLLMGGIAHSAGNALGMSGISNVISALSIGDPPNATKYALKIGRSDRSQEILELLRALWMGGRVVQAFIALVEIAARPGALRAKFQSTHPYRLSHCITSAEMMVDVFLDGQQGKHQEYQSRFSKLNVDKDQLIDVQFPEGYLSNVYIQTFLYELLLNASKHGMIYSETREVDVYISSEIQGGRLDIHVENAIPLSDMEREWVTIGGVALPKSSTRGKRQVHSFLGFTSAIAVYIPGVQLSSGLFHQDGFMYYRATLSLGAILIEEDEGGSQRFVQSVEV
jgi:hypothetical protein